MKRRVKLIVPDITFNDIVESMAVFTLKMTRYQINQLSSLLLEITIDYVINKKIKPKSNREQRKEYEKFIKKYKRTTEKSSAVGGKI